MNKQTVPIKRPYQRCTRCVMDTTDSKITFDENGVCDHCRNFDKTTLIISKKPGNTGISRDIRTEFTTDLLLSD